jgi:hypothetical protein
MTRFSYGASLQANKVSKCSIEAMHRGHRDCTHIAQLHVSNFFFSRCDLPSNLTSDLADESGALGQETLPPRDPGSGGPWGDLCYRVSMHSRLLIFLLSSFVGRCGEARETVGGRTYYGRR